MNPCPLTCCLLAYITSTGEGKVLTDQSRSMASGRSLGLTPWLSWREMPSRASPLMASMSTCIEPGLAQGTHLRTEWTGWGCRP